MAVSLKDTIVLTSRSEVAQLGTNGAAHTVVGSLIPMGYQQLGALGASSALTVPLGARIAYIQPQTAAVRWRDDGTAPTATIGQPLAVAATLEYSGSLANIRFIEVSAGAILNIVYYR